MSKALAMCLRAVVFGWLPSSMDRASVLSTADAAIASGRRRTVDEISSLVALGFRLRCRAATNDEPQRIIGQGAIAGCVTAGLLFGAGFLGVPADALRIVAIVVPAALLIAGLFDPRLAIATMVVWASRLVVIDHAAFVDDLRRIPGDTTPSELVARWVVMAAGVIVAAAISRWSIRQATRV